MSSVVILTVALAALTAFTAMNDGLAPPPLSLDGAIDWAASRDPVVAAFALIRLCAWLSAAYLLIVVIVSGLVRAFDAQRGTALLDRVPLGLARALVSVTGLGVLSIATSLSPASAQTTQPDTASIRGIDPSPAGSPADAVIRPMPDEPPPPPPSPTVGPSAPDAPEQYVIESGDCLWAVAASHLGEVTGRTDLNDEEIAGYWRVLVASNPLPNPDLLFVGQVIELPAVAG